MARGVLATDRGRVAVGAAASFLGHALLAGILALIAVNYRVAEPPEFVELNIGRLTREQLTRMLEEAEASELLSDPSERAQTPTRRLPQIDVPAIRPSEVERRLLPDRVAMNEERAVAPPPRPASRIIPAIPSPAASDRKAVFEGTTNLDIGPRPGEGIESEHVGSDIQPVFQIEGELQGRKFQEAAITTMPELPAQTQVRLDVVVAPSGSIISALIARKENARLENFAVTYIRRCRFDPLPANMPQENQVGRITITFTPRMN